MYLSVPSAFCHNSPFVIVIGNDKYIEAKLVYIDVFLLIKDTNDNVINKSVTKKLKKWNVIWGI